MPESTFSDEGKDFKITTYPGRGDGFPVLLLLHGNSGLVEPYARQIHGFAQSLAGLPSAMPGFGSVGLGYMTAVLDYFSDADSHIKEEDPAPHLPTLKAAIQHISDVTEADISRIGLIGYSLGARIAMTHIAEHPGTIKVLVDYFGPTKPFMSSGAVSPAFASAVAGFPPTITFHDVRDMIVPVDRSVELHSLFSPGTDHRLNVYVTEPVQLPSDAPSRAGDAPLIGNHAFKEGGEADIDSRNAAASWIVRHMPPTAA